MTASKDPILPAHSKGLGWLAVAAVAAAIAGGRPHAGSWNDGSRLAAVESLVDRGTFRIDGSVYVDPASSPIPPYSPHNPLATKLGTFDKLLIGGHYYSDKSPLPTVVMAAGYLAWRWVGGPPAASRPDLFARWMSALFAAIPLGLAVWCIGLACRSLRVERPWDLVVPAAFAFGTVALPYGQQVNNGVLLLAVAAALGEAMVRPTPLSRGRASWIGALAGCGYAIDLGAGPMLLVAIGGWMLVTRRGRVPWMILGALPAMIAHHVLNYMVGGTIGPANAQQQYLQWPGSPFTAENMTGGWNHPSPTRGATYALELLVGKKGLLLYSLPLVQAVAAGGWLLRRRQPERAVVAAFAAWAVGTWLLYAATSRNMSGHCLSVRWLIPLIAPGLIVNAILLRDVPWLRWPFAILAVGGAIMNVEMVWLGCWWGYIPWTMWRVPGVTLFVAGLILASSAEFRRSQLRFWVRRLRTRSRVVTQTVE